MVSHFLFTGIYNLFIKQAYRTINLHQNKIIVFKRQVTMNERNKMMKEIEPNKKLSFVSLQNSSFNLSFQNHNFENQNIKEDSQASFFMDSSRSSIWIQAIDNKNLTLENQQNIFTKINTLPLKVS